MEAGGNTTPRPLYPRETPGTHCIGGWVGPRAGLNRVRKISPPPGLDPRTVQPVASRYTDWAIPDRTATIHLNATKRTVTFNNKGLPNTEHVVSRKEAVIVRQGFICNYSEQWSHKWMIRVVPQFSGWNTNSKCWETFRAEIHSISHN
jgi:hypothetical protein